MVQKYSAPCRSQKYTLFTSRTQNPRTLLDPVFFLHSSRARLFSIKMGFETVWFSRKGPKPSADGVKGKVISGKGTRECRYILWRGKRSCKTQVRPCLASFLRGGTDFGTGGRFVVDHCTGRDIAGVMLCRSCCVRMDSPRATMVRLPVIASACFPPRYIVGFLAAASECTDQQTEWLLVMN